MKSTDSPSHGQSQRFQAELDTRLPEKRVNIRVENYDESRGWYTSSSLTFPLHQLPLMEQALVELRRQEFCDESSSCRIIPFPGLTADSVH